MNNTTVSLSCTLPSYTVISVISDPLYLTPQLTVLPSEISNVVWVQKVQWCPTPKNYVAMCVRLNTIRQRDRRSDGRTDGRVIA